MISPLSVLRLEYANRSQASVATLARAIAETMGLPERVVEGIYAAARVHDIGELASPAQLILKPGRLTEAEYARVREHCQVGYDMIKGVDCPWPIAETVLQHHERLDGSGYPAGLKGDEIEIGARVVGTADVVDAICSDRPHRPGRGIEAALDEIRANRATLYDGDVVDACDDLFRRQGLAWRTGPVPGYPPFDAWLDQMVERVLDRRR